MNSLLPGLEAAPNLHPFFVHLPLALWPTALLFWVLGLVRKRADLFRVGTWIVWLAAAAAIVALATGLGAEESLGHDSPHHDAIHVHKYWMIAATTLGVTTALAALVLRAREATGVRAGLTLLLGATVVVATLGGDRGAFLVFGHGIGVPSSGAADQVNEPSGGKPHAH